MKVLRSFLRFVAVAALSSFLTFFVLNRTLLSSSAWLAAADTAHVYEDGAKALNTTLATQTGTQKVAVTSGAVQVQVERYVVATDRYIRTGEIPPNLEGFSQLASSTPPGPAGASERNQSATALVWLRRILAQQTIFGIVALVATLLALLMARSGRRLASLAGILLSTALSMALWYAVLRFAPGLLTDNLAVDPTLTPFMPVFKNWLIAVFAIVNEQLLVVLVALVALSIMCFIGLPVARFVRRLTGASSDDSERSTQLD